MSCTQTTYSDVVVEKFYTFGTITAFPQPADQYATIYVNAAIDESAMLQVHDIAGRTVHTQSVSLASGENLIEMDCSTWVSGHYIITIAGEQLGEEVARFVVR